VRAGAAPVAHVVGARFTIAAAAAVGGVVAAVTRFVAGVRALGAARAGIASVAAARTARAEIRAIAEETVGTRNSVDLELALVGVRETERREGEEAQEEDTHGAQHCKPGNTISGALAGRKKCARPAESTP